MNSSEMPNKRLNLSFSASDANHIRAFDAIPSRAATSFIVDAILFYLDRKKSAAQVVDSDINYNKIADILLEKFKEQGLLYLPAVENDASDNHVVISNIPSDHNGLTDRSSDAFYMGKDDEPDQLAPDTGFAQLLTTEVKANLNGAMAMLSAFEA